VAAAFLGTVLDARYPGLLRTRYDIEAASMDGHDVIAAIARKRGYLRKGGAPDSEKAARALLKDLARCARAQ
jgi:ribosome biogenesis GTPase A